FDKYIRVRVEPGDDAAADAARGDKILAAAGALLQMQIDRLIGPAGHRRRRGEAAERSRKPEAQPAGVGEGGARCPQPPPPHGRNRYPPAVSDTSHRPLHSSSGPFGSPVQIISMRVRSADSSVILMRPEVASRLHVANVSRCGADVTNSG